MKNVVCIYSGGMDSFTLVNEAHYLGMLHSCLSFYYGQKHGKELQYARRVCNELNVPHHVIDLQVLKPHLLGFVLTDDVAMPEGHYAEENMRLTVVPNRNMVMLSIAIAYAVSHKLDRVWFGAHAEDRTVYPDCRESFVEAMDHAARIANWHPVRVSAPYINMDKAQILEIGYKLELDYAKSWTCYQGAKILAASVARAKSASKGSRRSAKWIPLSTRHEQRSAAHQRAQPARSSRTCVHNGNREDPDREGLSETPSRVFRAWAHYMSGYAVDPCDLLKTFEDGAQRVDEIVLYEISPSIHTASTTLRRSLALLTSRISQAGVWLGSRNSYGR